MCGKRNFFYIPSIKIGIKYCYSFYITTFNRHPNPKLRPQFGQIVKVLSTIGKYLLGWSEEDKQTVGEDAMKLGVSLDNGYNLFVNLQQMYKSKAS